MATAGSIVIDLLMKTGMFETDSKRAEARLKEMGKVARQAGAVIGAGLAAAGTAMALMTRNAIEQAAQIDRLSLVANTSAETFQRWAAGASMVGIEQDKLADILKDTQDKVGDFIQTGGGGMADFFEQVAPRVGVTAEQFRKLSGPDALQLYVSSLEKANLSQADMVFYLEAIASDSTLLLPLLRDNGRLLAEYGEEAANVGAIMGEDMLNAAAAAREEFARLDLVKKGLVNRMVAELLPTLSNLTSDLTDTAAGADLVGTAAEVAAAGIKILSSAGVVLGGVFKTVGEALGGAAAMTMALLQGDFSGMLDIHQMAWDDIKANASGTVNAVKRIWDEADPPTGRPLAAAARADGQLATGFVKDAGKKALSEAEKAAQKIGEVLAGLRKDLATFGMGDSELKLFDLQGMGASDGQMAEAKAILDKIDALEREKKAREEVAEAIQAEIEADLQYKAGIETLLADLAFEQELIKMTNDEREVAIALRYANAEAASEEGRMIADSIRQMQAAREAQADLVDLMDTTREAGKGLFRDLVDGENPLQAIEDAFGRIHEKILDMIAERLMDQLFGQSGDSGGGMFGNVVSGIFSGMFGGGRAGGGDAISGRAYLVGEQGPELFVPRTMGQVLNSDQLAVGGGGMSFQQVNNTTIAGRPDRRTPEQIARANGRAASSAISRTAR